MTSPLQFLSHARRRLASAWSRRQAERNLHPAVRKYIEFNRQLWGSRSEGRDDAVILIGLYSWSPCLPGYAHLGNHLARQHSASLEWYSFIRRRDWVTEKLYASFGVRPGLLLEPPGENEAQARALADTIFAGLRDKWDVVRITVEGLGIGEFIYDTYLRSGPHPTVDIRDRKLADLIFEAVLITFACRDYFSRKKVVAIIPDHFVYIFSGIVTRYALASGVPVYQVAYGPNFYAYAVSCPAGSKTFPMRWPHALYDRIFASLAPEEKETAREKGRRAIERRLSGHADGVLTLVGAQFGVPVVQSAYAGESSQPVLENTGRPRILVLLHDFCDAVHVYRDLLFPDFFEWIHFLLSRASATEFDWYVKPHPNVARDGVLAKVNGGVIDDLKSKYPKVRFLDPATSSRQIIREGVNAMFTGYGTAGHEFAYLGVPVVNAGDNPHIAYEFNVHPASLEDYAHCIAHADALKPNIRREDIEEYVYMNYFYFEEKLSADANPMSSEFFASADYKEHRSRPETLELLMHRPSRDEQAELARYFDHLPHVSEPLSLEVRLGMTRQPQATVLNS